MRVRVTLARTVEEYTDIYVPNVESTADAVAQVKAQLAAPSTRARLLNKQTWMRGDVVSELSIQESAIAD